MSSQTNIMCRSPLNDYVKGFTLLEVMIALAVFAVSAFALVNQTSQSVKQLDYLKQKTYALWIAENKLTELRLEPDWPALGTYTETITDFGQKWRIEADVVNTSEAMLRRVDLSVALSGSDVHMLKLQGFIGQY